MRKKKKICFRLVKKYKEQIHRDVFNLARRDADKYVASIKKLRSEDVLFLESMNVNDPYINTSCTNDYEILQGYANTAMLLLSIIEYGRNFYQKGCYIYPALFDMRIYLENIMKIIILKYNPHYNVRDMNHDLSRMWKVVQNYIVLDSYTKNIGHLLDDFQNHDSKACNLRFAYSLNEAANDVEEPIDMQIDISHIKTMFLHLYRFFDGIHEEININSNV